MVAWGRRPTRCIVRLLTDVEAMIEWYQESDWDCAIALETGTALGIDARCVGGSVRYAVELTWTLALLRLSVISGREKLRYRCLWVALMVDADHLCTYCSRLTRCPETPWR